MTRSAGGWRLWIGVIATVLVVNVLAMPRVLITGDPTAWREEARSILHSASLFIDPSYAQSFGEPGEFFVINHTNGHYYSKYGLMNALMSLPPALAEAVFAGQVSRPGQPAHVLIYNLYNIFLSLLIAAVLLLITARYTTRPLMRAVYVLACFYTTYFWFYQRAQSSEIDQVLFFATFFLLLTHYHQRPQTPLILGAWACLAALVLTRLAFAVLLVIPAAMIFYAAWVPTPTGPNISRPRALLVAFLPPLLILALLAWINHAKFGSIFLTGYHQWHVEDHRLTSNWIDGVYGFLFSIRWGIFFYFPLLLLAIAGIRTFVSRHPADAAIAFGSFFLLLFTIGSIPSWRGEWTYGPRYLIAVLPILALPAIATIEQILSRRPPFPALIATAVAAILLCSTYLQYQVNRLDFFAVSRISYPLEQNRMNISLFRYFNDQLEGAILRDLTRNQDHLRDSDLFKIVAKTLPPPELDPYQSRVADILQQTNWYWWPPPVPSANTTTN